MEVVQTRLKPQYLKLELQFHQLQYLSFHFLLGVLVPHQLPANTILHGEIRQELRR
jgi:hypothetical protein